MAMDHALLERAARTGERVLRVYTWERPTLSLGRNQCVRGLLDPRALVESGVALVRRPTGGRALLHHREVTYSVTAPLGPRDSVREWYNAITSLLLSGLHAMGVKAEPAIASGRTPIPGAAPCFVRAEAGEIAVGSRKLVGSALLRLEGAFLQHGSILVDDDQHILAALLPTGGGFPHSAATLREALGRAPDVEEVTAALVAALGSFGAETTALSVDAGLARDVARVEAMYAGEEWTWRL